jgi:hypothetical protein
MARGPPGAGTPGKMPREEGGGGIRDVGTPVPIGRGTTLTGRGTTLTGPAGTEAAGSDGEAALGSFSSPIKNLAKSSRPTTLTRSAAVAHDFRLRGAAVQARVGAHVATTIFLEKPPARVPGVA